MIQKLYKLLIFLCMCAVFVGCAKIDVPETGYRMPDYRSWKLATEHVNTADFPDHVGTFRLIYANDTAFEDAEKNTVSKKGFFEKKEGSIIVKETYASMDDLNAQKPLFITLMVKNSKNSLSKQGWIFVKKMPGEEYGKIITTKYCIGCHEGANESHTFFDGNPDEQFRDYLFLDIGGDYSSLN